MQRGEIGGLSYPSQLHLSRGVGGSFLIIQSDDFTRSRIQTAIAIVLTTNLRLAAAPGNVLVTTDDTRLPKDSVINVSQIITVDKSFLTERVSQVDDRIMLLVEDGVRTVLAL